MNVIIATFYSSLSEEIVSMLILWLAFDKQDTLCQGFDYYFVIMSS